MEEDNALPSFPISTIELQLIDYALFVYLVMAQRLPRQSPEGHAMLLTTKDLRQRMSAVKVPDSPDNWWTLFLPDGTRQIKKEMRDKATLYTICLSDGYCFLHQAPVFNQDKSYDTFPLVTVLDEPEEAQQ